jgi:hypothetical protein
VSERRVHLSQRAALRNEIPHARADAIEAEVQPTLQIEEDTLTAQFADDHLIAGRKAILD